MCYVLVVHVWSVLQWWATYLKAQSQRNQHRCALTCVWIQSSALLNELTWLMPKFTTASKAATTAYCGSSCGKLRWPCRRLMSWKGCRCRRRRHARALQTVRQFIFVGCLLTSKLYTFASGKKNNGQTQLDVLASKREIFFPEVEACALPGDDEGEEVFDLRKVRSMEKSSPEMRSGNVFLEDCCLMVPCFMEKEGFFGKMRWSHLMKKQIPSMKLLFVFFGVIFYGFYHGINHHFSPPCCRFGRNMFIVSSHPSKSKKMMHF